MKKLTLTLCLLLAVLIGVMGLSSCGNGDGGGLFPPKDPTPERLRINAPTTLYQGAADGLTFEIVTVYSDASETRSSGTLNNILENDKEKLSTVGTHVITVNYGGLTGTFQIEVVPSYEGPDGLRFDVALDDNQQPVSATLVGYTNGNETPEVMVIPSEYRGVPVTKIGQYVFGNSGIKKIVIPDTVTSIGSSAFTNCTGIEEIVIPASVTVIGDKAFYQEAYNPEYMKLQKVYYGGTLAQWCAIEFYNQSATPLYRYADLYIDDELVTDIVLTAEIEKVSNYAFYNCTSITSLTVDKNVEFGTECFFGCTGITEVEATALHMVNIERTGIKHLTVIAPKDKGEDTYKVLAKARDNSGYNTFKAIETLTVYGTDIGAACFYGCKTLKTVVLGDGVTELQEEAFYDCPILSEVTIGKDVVKMGRYVFAQTYSLDKVMIYDIAAWCTMDMASAMSFSSSGYVNGVYRTSFADLYLYDEEEEEFLKVKYLVIPETVTEISPYTFNYCNTIVGIKLSEGVEKIGKEAFYGCRNLIYVDLPTTLTEIGENAFSSCEKLYEVINRSEELEIVKGEWENGNLGGYAQLIKNDPNAGTSLRNRAGYIVHIRTGESSVVNHTDGYWETLVSWYDDSDTVYLDNADIDYIAPYAFYGLKNLKYLTLACPLLEKIGKNAFEGCEFEAFYFSDYSINGTEAEIRTTLLNKWASLVVESTPMLYGARLYVNEMEVTEITPADITVSTIRESVFRGWLGTSVHLSDSVNTIGKYAFQNCPNLTYVNIGNGVRNVDDAAFRYCYELNTVVLGTSASNVWSSAFDSDYALVELYSLNPNFNVGSLVHWMEREKGLPIVYTDLEAERLVSVDADGYVVATIGNEKWLVDYRGNSNEIIIPDGVTHIAKEIFNNNQDITKLVVPDSVKYIGDYAFGFCRNLTDVTLGNGIERIGYCALEGFNNDVYEWTTEEGINHIKYIGAYAIRGDYLHNEITIREGTRVIADGFKGSSSMGNVTKLNLPEGLITIGEGAFSAYESAYGITELVIPTTVTYIGTSAFYGAPLTSITLSNPDAYIGGSAFGNTDFFTVDGITIIGNTFMDIDGEVTGVYTVPGNVTTIQEYAFCDSQLTEIVVSDNVKYIYDYAFYRCSNLEKITIGAGVEYIGAELFASGEMSSGDCPEIHFNGTVEEWEAIEKSPIWVRFSSYAGEVYVYCTDGNVQIN